LLEEIHDSNVSECNCEGTSHGEDGTIEFYNEIMKLYTPLHGEAHTHAPCDTVMRLSLDTDNSRPFIHSNNISHPYRIRRITGQRSDTSRVDYTRELVLPYRGNRAS
jgi:hypothetical protein